MTIQQVIDWVDDKKHNVYTREDKLFWLERLERMAMEFMAGYADTPALTMPDLSPEGDPDGVLLIPSPWDQLYLRWLECQMDYAGQEYRRYNNSKAMFEAEWRSFTGDYNRSHHRRNTPMKYY